MVAIEGKVLPALRDNRNRWQISLDDLERWAQERGGFKGKPPTPIADRSTVVASLDIARLEEQLRAAQDQLEAQRQATEERLSDLRSQLSQGNEDNREAMALLREAQRPWWAKLRIKRT